MSFVQAFGLVLAAILVARMAGAIVRDRAVPLALLCYVPLWPIGLLAVLLDLVARGRALSRLRFGLTALGLLATLGSAGSLISWGLPERAQAGSPFGAVTVAQWNVQYGGSSRSEEPWRWIGETVAPLHPDVVILNEAVAPEAVARLAAFLGPEWTWVAQQGAGGRGYYFNLAVCARGAVRLERLWPVAHGSAMSVKALIDGRWLRILVVDGLSDPFVLRRPFLESVAKLCDEQDAAGSPFDFVAGDFNAVRRSLGFESIAASGRGYSLAETASWGWRGTFPAVLPFYDIDHLWVSAEHHTAAYRHFAHAESNHRGQVAHIQLGEPPIPAYLR